MTKTELNRLIAALADCHDAVKYLESIGHGRTPELTRAAIAVAVRRAG